MKLSENIILITGGATGIGLALTEQFLMRGNEVIICGRRENRLLEAKNKYPQIHIKVCDVSDRDQQQMLFEWATSQFPKINVLINNAGIQRNIDLKQGVQEILGGASEIQINLEAPILLNALFIPHLLKQKDPVIVNVSSGLAFTPIAKVPVYCATKAALHTYSLLLRKQLSDTGIRVFEVIPPGVETELNMEGRAKLATPLKGLTAQEYAASVINGLENDEYEIYNEMLKGAMNIPRAELEMKLLNLQL